MTHYWIELAIGLLLAYLMGCLIGWFLRNIMGRPAPVATLAAPTATTVIAPKVVAPAPVPMAPKVVMPTPTTTPVPDPTVRAPLPVMTTPARVAAPVKTAATVMAAAPVMMERPKGIAAARGGKADNLQRISGIGPKNEKILHTLGFFHFDQIANWTTKEQHWVDDHLKFHGRIVREEWVRQARLLADGKDAEFDKEFGTGGLKGKDGKTHSGSHTRSK